MAGTATFTFANGNAATFAYTMDGVTQTKAITRQLFSPPAGTRCGEPYRTLASFTVVAAGDIAQCDNAPRRRARRPGPRRSSIRATPSC